MCVCAHLCNGSQSQWVRWESQLVENEQQQPCLFVTHAGFRGSKAGSDQSHNIQASVRQTEPGNHCGTNAEPENPMDNAPDTKAANTLKVMQSVQHILPPLSNMVHKLKALHIYDISIHAADDRSKMWGDELKQKQKVENTYRPI